MSVHRVRVSSSPMMPLHSSTCGLSTMMLAGFDPWVCSSMDDVTHHSTVPSFENDDTDISPLS
jgi:hypothetical protein